MINMYCSILGLDQQSSLLRPIPRWYEPDIARYIREYVCYIFSKHVCIHICGLMRVVAFTAGIAINATVSQLITAFFVVSPLNQNLIVHRVPPISSAYKELLKVLFFGGFSHDFQ